MRKLFPAIIALVLSTAVPSFGKDWSSKGFFLSADLDYLLDNAEYDSSSGLYDASSTLPALRFTPRVGYSFSGNGNVRHSINAGVDIFKKFGEGKTVGDAFREVTVFYKAEASFGEDRVFDAYVGAFPRTAFKGDYRGPVFDTREMFLDNNVEGFYMGYKAERFKAELGLDWLGLLADAENPSRRERFQVLLSGDWNFFSQFHLAWTGSFYHYACSYVDAGVVDNHLFNPMIEWRAPEGNGFKGYVSAGGIFGYQRDRAFEDHHRSPMGFYSKQSFGWRAFSLRNQFYLGDDLQPYRSKYSDLYQGQAMFHIITGEGSWADELMLRFEPRICKCLSLFVALSFDFGTAVVSGAGAFGASGAGASGAAATVSGGQAGDAAASGSSATTGIYRGCRQILGLKIGL